MEHKSEKEKTDSQKWYDHPLQLPTKIAPREAQKEAKKPTGRQKIAWLKVKKMSK